MNVESRISTNAQLHIHLLGGFRIEYNGQPVKGFESPRLQSLLAYLILHRDSVQLRSHVAFQFWPDSTESQAHTNLRNLLYHFRRIVPEADSFLDISLQTLRWRSDTAFSCDVVEFAEKLETFYQVEKAGNGLVLRTILDDLISLYGGDLLPSCYDDWILPIREQLHQQYISSLQQLISLLEDQRQYQKAIRYAQRLLQHDPLHEAVYRQLMRLYALNGNRAAAVRTYHTCATVLQRELGVDPGPQTREAYELLLYADELPLAPQTQCLTFIPLVDRQNEWQILRETYRECTVGGSRIVFISGEAGIGKTRLAEELQIWVDRQGISTATARCYAAEGELPFAPVAAWLRTLPQPHLEKVWMEEAGRVLPELLPKQPSITTSSLATQSWQRRRLFEALTRLLLAVRQPMVLLLDDVHWCDRDTLEWLHYLLRYDPQAKIMIVATYRLEDIESNGTLVTLLEELRFTTQLVEIELGGIPEEETIVLAEGVAGYQLDAEIASVLFRESEGNPFFIVEMVQTGLSNTQPFGDQYKEKGDDTGVLLPPKVRMILEKRISQVSSSARETAEMAAVIGREFSFPLLNQVSQRGEEKLIRDLDELWRRRILREQGTQAYDFSHGLLRAVTYKGLSAVRRQFLHQQVARVLEELCDAGKSTDYAQVAVHYEAAGLPEMALAHYQRASEVALRTYAIEKAVDYLTKALSLLNTIEQTYERDECELELLLALGVPMILIRGHAYHKVGRLYDRALELCAKVDITNQRFQALNGLRRFNFVQGQYRKAYNLEEQLLSEAKRIGNPAYLTRAYALHGETLCRLGEFTRAQNHFVIGYNHYVSVQSLSYTDLDVTDAAVCCLVFGAFPLWFQGYPDQARNGIMQAMVLADKVDHPYTKVITLYFGASLHRLRRDVRTTQEATDAALQIAEKYRFAQVIAWLKGLRGWELAETGHVEKGINQMRQGLSDTKSIGGQIESINLLANLTEIYTKVGDVVHAQYSLDEAFSLMEISEERSWDAELHRLKGIILLLQHEKQAAEAAFQQALNIARDQDARILELRAAICLGRLWIGQDKKNDTRDLLQGIYDWFSEGYDEVDLKEAKSLLELLN